MSRKYLFSFLLLSLLFPLNPVLASGFVKLLYGIAPTSVLEGKNKSAIVLTETFYGYHPIYFLQETDSMGNVIQLVDLSTIQDTWLQGSVDIWLTQNKDIFAVSHFKDDMGKITQKISKVQDGSIVFTKNIINNDTLQPLSLRSYGNTTDNGFIQLLSNTNYTQYVMQKINNSGDIVFTKPIPSSFFNSGLDTVNLFGLRHELRITEHEGKYYISGIGLNRALNKYQLFQTIYNPQTDDFQYNRYALPEIAVNNQAQPVLFNEYFLNSGSMRVIIMHYDSTSALNTYYIEELHTENGLKDLVYTYQDSSNNSNFAQRLNFDKSGNLYFLKPNSLSKRDANGNLKWNRVLFPDRIASNQPITDDFIFMRNFTQLSDSGFYIIGKGGRALNQIFCFCLGVIIKTDKEGIVYRRQISGNIYADANNNCVPDNENGIKNTLVTAYNAKASYFGITDTLGNYKIPVENGSYTVKAFLPDSIYWQACIPAVQINTLTDTSKVDFALQRRVSCPMLQTDISIPFLRRCFENTYTIHYCNYGTATAQNAVIKVTFPQEIEVRNTGIPWSSAADNTFTFPLGNLNEQDCGSFTITAYLSCGDSSVLGETHCVEAHIFPDSLCLVPDSRWDGSEITVSGICLGDSVQFTVRNVGSGDMRNPNISYVLEGDFLRIAPVYFQLNAGQSQTFTFAADGSTQSFIAAQSAYYPFGGTATVSVEGCGGFIPGYVTHFTQENNSPFLVKNCTQNIGSYDPNDKTALPVGLDTMHYIAPSTPIQYIIRFQNTGTDTAFNIILEDSLSSLLDISTFAVGGSSHPFTYSIEQNGLLRIVFPNIMLPDSNKNQAGSMGYFSFSIKPKATLPENTKVENNAIIYFDFNEGVKTGTVFHAIKNNLYQFIVDKINEPTSKINYAIYPNPFSDQFTLTISDKQIQNKILQLCLYDLDGKEIYRSEIKSGVPVYVSSLDKNIYFFTISHSNEIISAGKIIKQ